MTLSEALNLNLHSLVASLGAGHEKSIDEARRPKLQCLRTRIPIALRVHRTQ